MKAVLYADGIITDEMSQDFGIRDLQTGKHHVLVNGSPIFLRGKHDGIIFPLTGYAPWILRDGLQLWKRQKAFICPGQ